MHPPFFALLRDADDDTWAGMIPTARESILFRAATTFDPKKNFDTAYNGSKAEEVINVPELAEHILSFLDIRNIIKTTRVCKQLHATLHSSEKLRTIAFLAPTPQQVILDQTPTYFNRAHMIEDIDNKNHHLFSCRVNPLFFSPPKFSVNPGIYAEMKTFDFLKMSTGSSAVMNFRPDGGMARIHMCLQWPVGRRPLLEIHDGLVREMVLTYQPRSISLELQIEGMWEEFRTLHSVRVPLAKNITAGGLVDIVNVIWDCACDGALFMANWYLKRTLEGKAEKRGISVAKWLESDVEIRETVFEKIWN